MAATDTFRVQLVGKGGHAAIPHLSIDPIVVGSQIVTALQTLVARNVDPLDSAVLSVTQFLAGSPNCFNVIPESIRIGGTIRTLRPETRVLMEERVKTVIKGVADMHQAKVDIKFMHSYPATINHEEQTITAAKAAAAVVGRESVFDDVDPTMGGEDFSYMLNAKPGCYVWLGAGGGPSSCMVHNPKYDFNDAIAPIGASWFATMVETEMPLKAQASA